MMGKVSSIYTKSQEGGEVKETNLLTTSDEVWNVFTVSEPKDLEIIVDGDITSGSLSMNIDGATARTITSSDTLPLSLNYGMSTSLSFVTDSAYVGNLYVSGQYGSGINKEVYKIEDTVTTNTLNVSAPSILKINILNQELNGGSINIDIDGVSQTYGIIQDSLRGVTKGVSSYFSVTTSDSADINFSSYDNKNYNITEGGQPTSVTFNQDYTKMYVLINQYDAVYQYSVSGDIDSASYDGVSFSVAGQQTSPYSLVFNQDFTKFYIVGEASDIIHQYTMGTTDISGSSYDNLSFDISSQEKTVHSLAFNADHTKFYILGAMGDRIYQYTMGSDISTSSYDGRNFYVGGQERTPYELVFNQDCTKFYVCGSEQDTIYQYSMGVTDISDSSYDNIFLDVGAQEGLPCGITFNMDYTKFYIVGLSTKNISQYTFGSTFNGVSYVSVEY